MSAPALAIVLHDLSATGVARNALAIAGAMAERGWRVTVAAVRAEGPLAEAVPPGIGLAGLLDGRPRSTSRSREMARAVLPLRRLLVRGGFDVVLSAGNHAHRACWAATRGLGSPRRVYRISNATGTKRAVGRRSPRGALRAAAFALIMRDAAAIVAVSEDLRDDPALRTAAGKLTVIANGVDLARVRALAAMEMTLPWIPDGTPVVLGVGRLVPQKNFAVLVDACAIAARTMPLRLVILGAGSDASRAALMARARALGFADRLTLPGVVANPYAAMARAAVVALPSLWEGSPNVLLEALACGTPVVASRTAGNAARILDDGRHGVLVDPRDAGMMARAIVRQCDPSLRVAPGDRAAAYDAGRALAAWADVLAAAAQPAVSVVAISISLR